jgi:hypothetical protein
MDWFHSFLWLHIKWLQSIVGNRADVSPKSLTYKLETKLESMKRTNELAYWSDGRDLGSMVLTMTTVILLADENIFQIK